VKYLESLTLRLAQGMNRLPEDFRARHAAYLLGKQNADGGFPGREGGSDLYYTGFALRGLAITGELQGEVAAQAAVFLKSKLVSHAPIIDFLSLLYGAMLLENSAGINIFADSPANWRASVAVALERFRRPDGGYAKTDEGQSSSTYYTFLVLLCLELIGMPPVERERLVRFIHSRWREDGGFVEIGPMKRSGTNPTAAAIGSLKVLDAIDDETREVTIDFLAELQNDEGGFLANTRIPVADVLSTFTGVLTLGDLGGLGRIDLPAARRYVESMQLAGGGFRGGLWDDATDVEYTFYGLGAAALVAATHESI
jgi:geranylgeranyl transferase type-2 subunit beta